VKELSILFGHRPRTIDRAGLVVRPKQPYVDWANSMDDDGSEAELRQLRDDPSIYLVEAIDFLDGIPELIDSSRFRCGWAELRHHTGINRNDS